ncbi:Hypothetical protein R9X50_00377100 [Acrodontium crateriforme]|uniref:C2H2-type domain-containing protein n=1 Tax=Acrodontium crateriforme TaxID=150365 RepID=A0AAQ3M4T1_9PEZI|nr:Hypothetical protein R9X50_00377100 [Acrodontium crateriforme]
METESHDRQPSPRLAEAALGLVGIATVNGVQKHHSDPPHAPSVSSRATSSVRLGPWTPSMEDLAPRRKRQQTENDRRGRPFQSAKASMNVFRLKSPPNGRVRHDSRASHNPFSPTQSVRSWSNFNYMANEHTGRIPLFQSRDLFQKNMSGGVESESVELDLLRIFTRIWHLRAYIRGRRSQGRGEWRDPIIINDSYGIEQSLSAWACDYKPDSLEYAASMLFKEAFWIYFHRTIQPSRPDPAFRRAVDEGLHYWGELLDDFEEMDKDVLLTSLVLLGCAAFDPTQRSGVVGSIERVAKPSSIPCPMTGMLAQLWRRMDKGYEAQTWDWEACFTYSTLNHVEGAGPFLSELLKPSQHDPWSRSGSRGSFASTQSRNALASLTRSTWSSSTATPMSAVLRLPPLLSPASKGSDPIGHPLQVLEPRPSLTGGDSSDRNETSSLTSPVFPDSSKASFVASPIDGSHNLDLLPPTIPGPSSMIPQPFSSDNDQSGNESHPNSSRLRPIDSSLWASMVIMDQRPPEASAPPNQPPRINTQINHTEDSNRTFSRRISDAHITRSGPFTIPATRHTALSSALSPTSPTSMDLMQTKSGRPRIKTSQPSCSICGKGLKNPSDAHKHQLQHKKPYKCSEVNCSRSEGFATPNDLQRHQISVHRSKPVLGTQSGYICVACPQPPAGIPAKYWPRRDNFRAHIKRKHAEWDEGILIERSEASRPEAQEESNHDSPQNSQLDRSDGSA